MGAVKREFNKFMGKSLSIGDLKWTFIILGLYVLLQILNVLFFNLAILSPDYFIYHILVGLLIAVLIYQLFLKNRCYRCFKRIGTVNLGFPTFNVICPHCHHKIKIDSFLTIPAKIKFFHELINSGLLNPGEKEIAQIEVLKDQSLKEMWEHLIKTLPDHQLEIWDFLEDDPFTIGISIITQKRIIAYVNTNGSKDTRYSINLAIVSDEPDLLILDACMWQKISIGKLAEIIRQYLRFESAIPAVQISMN